MTRASDIQAVSAKRLNEIFHAGSALPVDFGYRVTDSMTTVSATAWLVELRSGNAIWQDAATATDGNQQNGNNGLVGMRVSAAVKQIACYVTDKAHPVAGLTSDRLLAHSEQGGLLTSPRDKHVSVR
ncbi:GNA1162 family protein [Pantoea sp. NSTU24]|uniref:GNA1162 family protein n=1 Tax=Pantoea sp. NSTU24 TaxID=3391144 RepID=UPI003CFE7D11